MAQLLVTHVNEKNWYSPIASIRNYNEPDFEAKLFRYSNDIFHNYYVLKFKYPLQSDDLPGSSFEPDLLLISKSFKKWILLEVELCKNPTGHTKNQITCFSNPKFVNADLIEFVLRQDASLIPFRDDITQLIADKTPELLIVLDDYSDSVFKKYTDFKKDINICVMEVYRRAAYDFESYRFGGNYPYELTLFTKLTYFDEQHYQILKSDIVRDLPPLETEFELFHNMIPLKGFIIKGKRNKFFLKLPDHQFPLDLYLQLGIDIDGKIILQKL